MRPEAGLMTASRLGIIAGGGDLPWKLADHATSLGRGVFVLALSGFADPELQKKYGGVEAAMGEIGKGIRVLKEAGCREIVFAGKISRPDLSSLKFDLKGASLLPDLVAAGKGGDALLRVVLNAFERAGFTVIGADDVLDTLVAPAGPLGKHAPKAEDWVDLRAAAAAAAEVGGKDVGQGAVGRGGVVVASEAEDGTDAMLRRVAESGRGSGGVLVKRPKPQQERRIDLPTIGTQTVVRAHAAGLAGIAVEAGAALVMNREELAKEADRLGLFVYGFTAAELS
jgi:DUF1009 family protein